MHRCRASQDESPVTGRRPWKDLDIVQIVASLTAVMRPSVEILREHGVNPTSQRAAVLAAVAAHPHSSADAIAEIAREDLGSISRQSVYDALALLVETGIVRRIQPIGSPALYESRVGDNHHHLICRECGAVVDVDCAVGFRPCLQAADDHGFDIDEADVAYWGRCPDCRTASPAHTI